MENTQGMLKEFDWGGLLLGHLPKGCEQCLEGAKSVIFVTGKCGNPSCKFYCPISLNRREKDLLFVNENNFGKWDPKKHLEGLIQEISRANSEGASFTGGNPLLVPERVEKIGEALKKHFGEKFHLHLYAPIRGLDDKILENLQLVIDEIRFHPTSIEQLEKLENIFLLNWEVGIEIPAFPGQDNYLFEIACWLGDRTSSLGYTPFLNINQLEFSESNYRELMDRGFKRDEKSIAAVYGSEETARKVVERVFHEKVPINLHYCPSQAKDSIQLPNRLLRYARNTAQPFDIIREEGPHRGLLIRGVVRGINTLDKKQKDILSKILLQELEIPEEELIWDSNKNRFLINPLILEELGISIRKLGESYNLSLEIGFLEEYPTSDGLETGFDPI